MADSGLEVHIEYRPSRYLDRVPQGGFGRYTRRTRISQNGNHSEDYRAGPKLQREQGGNRRRQKRTGSGARPFRRSAFYELRFCSFSIRSARSGSWSHGWSSTCCWFVGLTIDEKVFDASTFSKNRDRLLTHEVTQEFLSSLLGLPEVKGPLSAEHFSVDGTMLKAWASMKSFRPKGSSDEDPRTGSGRAASAGAQWQHRLSQDQAVERDAGLDDGRGRTPLPQRRRAGESRLAYLGHALMENRNGLVAAAEATLATGTPQ